MRKILLIMSLLCFSCKAMADIWSGAGVIEHVTSHNGLHIIKTSISDSPCSAIGKFYWSTSDDDAQDMLTISLAGLMSGNRVKLVYDDSAPNCLWNGAEATHIQIFSD